MADVKRGDRVRVSFEADVSEDETILCTPFGTPYKFWCSADYIRQQGGVVEVIEPAPSSSDAPNQTEEVALPGAVAIRVRDAIRADEQDQADAVDPEVHTPTYQYLRGYKAATERAAEVVMEMAWEDGDEQPAPVADSELRRQVHRAIADPGQFVQREKVDDEGRYETVPLWGARAVMAVVAPRLEAKDAEIEQLRTYAETTRHHQQQHTEAYRELEKVRGELEREREIKTEVLDTNRLAIQTLRGELRRERESRQDWATEAMRLDVKLEQARHERNIAQAYVAHLVLSATGSWPGWGDETEAAVDLADKLIRSSWKKLRAELEAWQGHDCEARCTRAHVPPDGSPFGADAGQPDTCPHGDTNCKTVLGKTVLDKPYHGNCHPWHYHLRSRLNGVYGALAGQGNELAGELRAAIGFLDESAGQPDTEATEQVSERDAALHEALQEDEETLLADTIEQASIPATPTEPRVWSFDDDEPDGVTTVTTPGGAEFNRGEDGRWHSGQVMHGYGFRWNDLVEGYPFVTEVVGDQAPGGES